MRSLKRHASTGLALCALIVALGAVPIAGATVLDVKASGAKTFYVDERAGANQVIIFSQSTIEDFNSVINRVAGQFQLDPKNLEAINGKFSVRVQDIKTGLDLRDHDLYGPDWLDSAKYPLIEIKVARAEKVQKKSANTATMTLVGTATIHGITHDVQISSTLIYLDESPVTMQRAKGDLISVRADFQFKLSDYKITGPKTSEAIGLKVGDVQPVKVSIFASSVPPPPPLDMGGLAPAGQQPAGTQPGEGPSSAPPAPKPNYQVLPPPQRPSR